MTRASTTVAKGTRPTRPSKRSLGPKSGSARPPAVPKRAKTARLEARIRPELRALIERAADLEGRTFTEFVTESLQRVAQQAIAEAQVLRLSLTDQELFATALITPPEPAPALVRAFARHRKLVTRR